MTPPVRPPARRWRTPPALTHGEGMFEGADVLEELNGPLGMLLFHLVRDVRLWAATPPEKRACLFVPRARRTLGAMLRAAKPDPELKTVLRELVRLTEAPAAVPAERVALACRRVAHWADDNALLATSLAFAQCAAMLMPADAACSFEVGRLARRRAEYARAETWFRRAIVLGRQSGDRTTYRMALVGLGHLYIQRGDVRAARAFGVHAVRSEDRNKAVEGRAVHELFAVAIYAERHKEAQSLARAAFEAYGEQNAALPGLAHDVAYWWVGRGHFQAALSVFQALVHHLQRDDERVMAQAGLARAAAGAGERQLFEQTWDDVWEHMSRMQSRWNAATVMLELAHGAAMMGEHERAERAAGRAVQVARERDEAKVLLAAESILDKARRAGGVPDGTAPAAVADTAAENEVQVETLAMDLVRALDASLAAR